jgi:hypothetical protein
VPRFESLGIAVGDAATERPAGVARPGGWGARAVAAVGVGLPKVSDVGRGGVVVSGVHPGVIKADHEPAEVGAGEVDVPQLAAVAVAVDARLAEQRDRRVVRVGELRLRGLGCFASAGGVGLAGVDPQDADASTSRDLEVSPSTTRATVTTSPSAAGVVVVGVAGVVYGV